MNETEIVIGLDVGSKRIGVALGNNKAKLASPYNTVLVDGTELNKLEEIIASEQVNKLVVGLPRGLDAQETAQTKTVREFAVLLERLNLPIVFQDEAGTTKQAEEELKNHQFATKHGVDAVAAAILLQDYLDLLP